MYQGNLKRTDASRAPDPNSRSWFEINPNREQPSPEEVKEQVRCASVPSRSEPIAKFQTYARIIHDVAHVTGFLAVLSD